MKGSSPAVPALVLAARAGDMDRVAALLAGGASSEGADPAGVTALVAAAAAGHAEVARALLAAGARPEAKALDGTTALLAAIARGRVGVAMALLATGPGPLDAVVDQPSSSDISRFYAARLAAESGDADLLRAVIAAGAEARGEDAIIFLLRREERAGRRVVLRSTGTSPSGLAREMGEESSPDVFALESAPPLDLLPEALRRLVAVEGAGVGGPGVFLVVDANARAVSQGTKPRFFSCVRPAFPALDLHDELCAPSGGARRREALEWAAQRGAVEALRALAPKKAEAGRALGFAAAWSHRAAVEALLDMGADPNARSGRLGTALGAAVMGREVAIVRRLLAAGARPDGDPRDEPPLISAVGCRQDDLLEALLEAGASPAARSPRKGTAWSAGGETALHVAVGRKEAAKVRRLLDAGAPVDARDGLGRTPLHVVCGQPSAPWEVAELLLGREADLEARDARGYTPLLTALEGTSHDVALKLLDRRARVDAEAQDGATATKLAGRWSGTGSLVKLLISLGAR